MRGRRRTVLIGVLGAVLVIAGCGGTPAEPSVSPNPFPPRPKNLDLTNVDLCATLTPAQREERGIDRGSATIGTVDGEQAPTCGWIDDDTGKFFTVQILRGSAAIALQTPGSRVVDISGFGAVRGPNDNPTPERGTPPFCQIPIDISDNQSLRVQYESDVGDAMNPAEQETACEVATGLAEEILANVAR